MAKYVRAPGVLAETIDGRVALVTPDGAELITLNRVGTEVWDALAETGDARSIAARLAESHAPVDPVAVRGDVDSFLADLLRLGLVRIDR